MTANLVLIGCGAISQGFYLPALAKLRGMFGRVWLVDPSDRALSIAGAMVEGKQAHFLGEVDDDINLAIIATPNSTHFPLACEAISRGADVLIEKPFVIWPENGRRLLQVASQNGRVLSINQTRRFFPLATELRRQVSKGAFGPLKSITHREGTKLAWPFESGAGFAAGAQRTGAIMDFGVHVVDFYHYILQPEWSFVSATHDGFNGPEGLADIELLANGAPVSIRLSRYQDQENVARLSFEAAEVSFNVYEPATYTIRKHPSKIFRVVCKANEGNLNSSIAERVLLNFLAVGNRREQPVCDAADSMPVIELLDKVYQDAGRYPVQIGAV